MAKNPSTRWYFNDWRNDTELMACSDAAQGLWAWLLCLCAEADGYLRIAGQAPSISQLAQLRGRDKRTISRQLKELERNGVFDRTEDGTIYNRRMVREAEARRINGATKRCRGGAKVGQKFVKPLHPHRDPNQAELFDNSEKTRTRAGDSDSDSFAISQNLSSIPKLLPSLDAAREEEGKEEVQVKIVDEGSEEVATLPLAAGRPEPTGPPTPVGNDSDPNCWIKTLKKEKARQRCMAFVCATYVGDRLERRMLGLAGADPEHDEQWWFDHVDEDRKRRHWRAAA